MKIDLKNFLIEVLGTILGAGTMAFAVSLFLLPNELSSGGFSGIATIFYYLFSWKMGTVILILNIPLFILAMFKIGKAFIVKSLIGTATLSFLIDVFDKFEPLTNDKILACLYGGILTGIGTAIILRSNSSTGGSDLATIIIKEFKSTFRTGNILTIIDFTIVMLNVIFLRNIEIGLYSFITIYLMGKVVDILVEGIYFTKLLFIISDKSNEISKLIGKKVKRGVTGIYGKGMYTETEKLVLMCAVGRNDISEIRRIVKKIDSQAFMIITNSREVFGRGFKEKIL